jgi:FlgD Ig-like domain/IPT/TIG domain
MFTSRLIRTGVPSSAVAMLVMGLAVASAHAATVTGFSPQRGETGTEVKIIGTGFGPAIGVEFGGVDARFRVVTSTLVRAWVPEGATSGPIRLVLASETVQSPIEFFVPSRPVAGVAFASPWPNPSTVPFRLSFSLPMSGATRLTIHDARGARIRRLVDEDLSLGPHDYVWDGADDRGRRVARGLYFARLDAPGASLSRRLVLR